MFFDVKHRTINGKFWKYIFLLKRFKIEIYSHTFTCMTMINLLSFCRKHGKTMLESPKN